MSIARVTEITAESKKSFDDAIQQGVERSSKTLKNVKSAWVADQGVTVDGKGNVDLYQVRLKVTFVLD